MHRMVAAGFSLCSRFKIVMSQIQAHMHRLEPELYKGTVYCTFTCCVQNRFPLFIEEEIFKLFESKLLGSLSKFYCNAQVYLFMPDHIHLLLNSESDLGDVRKAVIDFKQQTGYWLSKQRPTVKWQKDFFDHILRKEEDIEKQVKYILENPVRKGLVNDWKDYPYKGSTIYDFNEWR